MEHLYGTSEALLGTYGHLWGASETHLLTYGAPTYGTPLRDTLGTFLDLWGHLWRTIEALWGTYVAQLGDI